MKSKVDSIGVQNSKIDPFEIAITFFRGDIYRQYTLYYPAKHIASVRRIQDLAWKARWGNSLTPAYPTGYFINAECPTVRALCEE